MTKPELLKRLKELPDKLSGEFEKQHILADEALVEYINDAEIENAYEDIEKWYS